MTPNKQTLNEHFVYSTEEGKHSFEEVVAFRQC